MVEKTEKTINVIPTGNVLGAAERLAIKMFETNYPLNRGQWPKQAEALKARYRQLGKAALDEMRSWDNETLLGAMDRGEIK